MRLVSLRCPRRLKTATAQAQRPLLPPVVRQVTTDTQARVLRRPSIAIHNLPALLSVHGKTRRG